ncbi:uncharacterized protein EAF01_001330 [Botrytis porri]|uniref:uncharacterized protein n=1 Tax=Botrytis porri TaxID=87229 RepID=UPI001901BF94|nr:uncharacterized protein EAF01_001330 [Botrytis porri]KAF7912309.1 hypothetical protein EAF01_001330 [Botrytis porri]
MEDLVDFDNRLTLELREFLLDITGFKPIRVSNVEGDVLDILFRHTLRVPESDNGFRVPPDFGPFPIYPIVVYKDKISQSIPKNDVIFIPIYQQEAMWIHFESRGIFAVKVIVDGVNAVSGEPYKEILSVDPRRLASIYENKSVHDYIIAGTISQRCLDAIKIKGDEIMKFVAAPIPNHTVPPSTESSIEATDGTRRVQFEIVPRRISELDRIPITVHTLSGEAIHLNISIESTAGDLIDKIHNITSIRHDEQRIAFADQQLEFGKSLYRYVKIISIFGGRPRSHEAQKYSPRTAAHKRLPEHYETIQEDYSQKRDVIFADTNTNIAQDIEADTFDAEDWDIENTLILTCR